MTFLKYQQIKQLQKNKGERYSKCVIIDKSPKEDIKKMNKCGLYKAFLTANDPFMNC